MKTTNRRVARTLASIVLAAGVATSLAAGPRQAVPRSGGAGPRVSSPVRHGGPVQRTAPQRGTLAPSGTASGVAHYGHHHRGSFVIVDPWWDWGWYGWWDWPGYGYAGYGPWYGAWYAPYDRYYVQPSEAQPSNGPASVETGVSPSNAEVVLDGESVGFAKDYNGRWDELSVAPGPHTIAFKAKGYRTLVMTFEARPGASYGFHDALVPGEGEDQRELPAVEPVAAQETPPQAPAPAATGRLRIHAVPPDAAVYLDGEYLGMGADLGRIHGSLAVATGTHRLEAVRPGYVSAVRTIEVGGTDPASVELTLERERER
jgi:hypothetical protein